MGAPPAADATSRNNKTNSDIINETRKNRKCEMQERCHVHKKEKKVTHNLLRESLRFHLESSSEQTFHEEFLRRPHAKEMLEKKKKMSEKRHVSVPH